MSFAALQESRAPRRKRVVRLVAVVAIFGAAEASGAGVAPLGVHERGRELIAKRVMKGGHLPPRRCCLSPLNRRDGAAMPAELRAEGAIFELALMRLEDSEALVHSLWTIAGIALVA